MITAIYHCPKVGKDNGFSYEALLELKEKMVAGFLYHVIITVLIIVISMI